MIHPLVGPMQGKVWGSTQSIFRSDDTEVNFINARAGWQCSEHFHNRKYNRFYVISGRLRITIFGEQSNDVTELGPGMCTDVPSGVYHKFEAVEDSLAIEIYWVGGLDPDDIVRRTIGGQTRNSSPS